MNVEVVRSKKRRKTVALLPTADGVRISIPYNATKAEEAHYVETLMRKYEKRQQSEQRRKEAGVDLEQRAKLLAQQYGYELPNSIRWVSNQNSRWGSCSIQSRTIRISDRAANFPIWVIDHIVAHELSHLTVRLHNARFTQLEERYPRTERARGFLIAKAYEEGNTDEAEIDDDESLDLT